MKKVKPSFYKQDALIVGPSLLGKILVRKLDNGKIFRYRITETEVYRGEEDKACHARFGITNRTMPLYAEGGLIYVYLCYGIHYLFNIVTGEKGKPQAVLIRGIENYNGPGKLTKALNIDLNLNKENLNTSKEIWLEEDGYQPFYKTTSRIGIDYATEPYKSIEWRFVLIDKDS
ncbi:MAG: DNA-3-methyladenine glycosylase [Bacilli bacterium]